MKNSLSGKTVDEMTGSREALQEAAFPLAFISRLRMATDGAGVYALPTDEHTIVCFDRFGATLGTIKIEDTIDIYYRLSFENGCLRVVDSYPNGKTDAVNALYLPTGEQLS